MRPTANHLKMKINKRMKYLSLKTKNVPKLQVQQKLIEK